MQSLHTKIISSIKKFVRHVKKQLHTNYVQNTTVFYYNGKQVDEVPKNVSAAIGLMERSFSLMEEAFNSLNKHNE